MAQAEEARALLCAAHGWALDRVVIVPVTASGDKIQDRPLAEIGGKALWTKELDAWLLAGEIDFAVHSAKDVETLRPAALTIAAVLPREDVRDVLIGAASIHALAARRAGWHQRPAPRRAIAPRPPRLRGGQLSRQCRDPAGASWQRERPMRPCSPRPG